MIRQSFQLPLNSVKCAAFFDQFFFRGVFGRARRDVDWLCCIALCCVLLSASYCVVLCCVVMIVMLCVVMSLTCYSTLLASNFLVFLSLRCTTRCNN